MTGKGHQRRPRGDRFWWPVDVRSRKSRTSTRWGRGLLEPLRRRTLHSHSGEKHGAVELAPRGVDDERENPHSSHHVPCRAHEREAEDAHRDVPGVPDRQIWGRGANGREGGHADGAAEDEFAHAGEGVVCHRALLVLSTTNGESIAKNSRFVNGEIQKMSLVLATFFLTAPAPYGSEPGEFWLQPLWQRARFRQQECESARPRLLNIPSCFVELA